MNNTVRIYTRLREGCIKQVDIWFNENVTPKDLDEECQGIMKRVDNATLIDKNVGTIQTPFGVTSIYNLSSSCKTVIAAYLLKKTGEAHILNATECGAPAMNEVFRVVKDSNVSLIIQHAFFEAEDGYTFIVNTRHTCTTDSDLMEALLRALH